LPRLVCCFSRRLLFAGAAGAAGAGSLHLALPLVMMSPRSDDAIISMVERRDRRHSMVPTT
jgi:hypothetical protein